MDNLQRKHRQDQKDLQSKITQKKKSATKKTRKGVNDECAELESRLKERHQHEVDLLADGNGSAGPVPQVPLHDDPDTSQQEPNQELEVSMEPPFIANGTATSERLKKPNRQKARLARRAAEQEAAAADAAREADDIPNLRAQEQEAMQQLFKSKGLREQPIRSDGHCLYAAIADQLLNAEISLIPKFELTNFSTDGVDSMPGYQATRQVAATYISTYPDDFVPFLEQPLDDYVRTIRETGEWGGHLELLALAKAYQVDIKILHGSGQIDVIEGASPSSRPSIWLAYYRHSFGLGEHYNSLRRTS